jgi:hypothetical protein
VDDVLFGEAVAAGVLLELETHELLPSCGFDVTNVS